MPAAIEPDGTADEDAEGEGEEEEEEEGEKRKKEQKGCSGEEGRRKRERT